MTTIQEIPTWFLSAESSAIQKQHAAELESLKYKHAQERATHELTRSVKFAALVESLIAKEKVAIAERWSEFDTSGTEANALIEHVIKREVQP